MLLVLSHASSQSTCVFGKLSLSQFLSYGNFNYCTAVVLKSHSKI